MSKLWCKYELTDMDYDYCKKKYECYTEHYEQDEFYYVYCLRDAYCQAYADFLHEKSYCQ